MGHSQAAHEPHHHAVHAVLASGAAEVVGAVEEVAAAHMLEQGTAGLEDLPQKLVVLYMLAAAHAEHAACTEPGAAMVPAGWAYHSQLVACPYAEEGLLAWSPVDWAVDWAAPERQCLGSEMALAAHALG